MPGLIRLHARVGRGALMLIAVIVALLLTLSFLDWFRIVRGIPLWLFWRSELAFLTGIEVAYGVTLILSVLAVPALSFVCLAARRRGRSPRRAALAALRRLAFGRADCGRSTCDSSRDTGLAPPGSTGSSRRPFSAGDRGPAIACAGWAGGVARCVPRSNRERGNRPGRAGRVECGGGAVSKVAVDRRACQMAARGSDQRDGRATRRLWRVRVTPWRISTSHWPD